MKKLLILGGTKDASDLANKMVKYTNLKTIYSLAGKTKKPNLPMCDVRIGGFGGIKGLMNYLEEKKIDLVVDATHPFAEKIAANNKKACTNKRISYLKFNRPPWQSNNQDWIIVKNLFEAAKSIERMGRQIFLSIGAKGLEAFNDCKEKWFLIRLIEKPNQIPNFPHYKLILERGPFDLEHEKNILLNFKIDVLITKNSGGALPSKLLAAKELNIPVVMVDRPSLPKEIMTVPTLKRTLRWIDNHI